MLLNVLDALVLSWMQLTEVTNFLNGFVRSPVDPSTEDDEGSPLVRSDMYVSISSLCAAGPEVVQVFVRS
jgi:hypothetical protein